MTNATAPAPPPAYVVASIRPTAVPNTSVPTSASGLDSDTTAYSFLPDDPLASQLALLKHLPGSVYRTLRSALPRSLGSLPTTERIRVWAVRDASCNTLRIHVFRRNVLRVVDSEPVAGDPGSIPLDPMSMAARGNTHTGNDVHPPPPPYATIARGDVPLDLVRTLPRASQPIATHTEPNSHIVNMPASAPTLARGTPVPFSAIRLGVMAIAADPKQPFSAGGAGQCVCPPDSALVIDDGVDLLDHGTRPAVTLYVNQHEIQAVRQWVLRDLPKAQGASGMRSIDSVAAQGSPTRKHRASGCDACCDSCMWSCFVTSTCDNLCWLMAGCFEALFDACGAACVCCCETTGQIECDAECCCCCLLLLN